MSTRRKAVSKAVSTAFAVLTVAAAAHALEGAPFAHRRAIDAPAGFARLTLPDDVLDACRAGLADLRIVDADGQEVPYAIGPLPEPRLTESPTNWFDPLLFTSSRTLPFAAACFSASAAFCGVSAGC